MKQNQPAGIAAAPVTQDQSATSLAFTKSKDDVNGLDINKKKSSQYFQDLKNLNESVVAWIKQHVEKNPFCILTPVFSDYEKHLADIEKSEKESTAVIDLNKQTSTSQDVEVKEEEKVEEKKGTNLTGFICKNSLQIHEFWKAVSQDLKVLENGGLCTLS